ncbi:MULTISPECIES: hypothetical protein [Agrobacterium]|uniref:Uncharacterized protein n=1 Tax=Agrobacterium larrymoorei TaxID=160699 RepID=A0ABX8TC14_9HYPH|nr:hypothetical protein [Agrobacterium larrymoorei]NSZ10077.1 hypothetical protein [Agrobacterium tumefaciens]QYA10807.1 hypothetical protein J5285_25985 [Agrobacterium larrymoorei]
MRLHTALEHIKAGSFRTMEPWKAGELDEMTTFISHYAGEIMEFSFDYVDTDEKGETLQTFINFANDLWDAAIVPIPHRLFWVSWVQKVMDQSVKMAAFCERLDSPSDNRPMGLTVRVMFESQRGTGFSFINQVGHFVLGDHKQLLMNYADNDSSALLVENGVGIVKALLGALATPQAIRREEPAPDKLNKSRAKKGRVPIRPVVVIDVRASQQLASAKRGEGSYTVRPHWRRGHIRHLNDGRLIPIPPCCVNMETGVPIKPEYVVKV